MNFGAYLSAKNMNLLLTTIISFSYVTGSYTCHIVNKTNSSFNTFLYLKKLRTKILPYK